MYKSAVTFSARTGARAAISTTSATETAFVENYELLMAKKKATRLAREQLLAPRRWVPVKVDA